MQRRDALKTLLGTAGFAISAVTNNRASFGGDPATGSTTSKSRNRTTRFAHLTDVHVHDGRNAPQGLAKAIRHVHSLDVRPDFILNGGDAIDDALEATREKVLEQWALWHSTWQREGSLPMRHCLGNHDVWGWNPKSGTRGDETGWGKGLALEQLGLKMPYYQFDAGGWRFLVLDSMTFDPETAYRAELDKQQLAWLTEQLESCPAEMPILIASHIPILTVGSVAFTPELRKHPQASKMLSHRDAFELLALLQKYPNVKLCLSGHTHQTERLSYAGIDFVNSGAVCGFWWKGNFNHTDEGYNVVDLFDDGTYDTHYVSYGWDVPA